MTVSTKTTTTTTTTTSSATLDTSVETVNENRNMFSTGNVNNHHLNEENELKLIEDSRVAVTKDVYLCRICFNYDQIERFEYALLHICTLYVYLHRTMYIVLCFCISVVEYNILY